MFCQVEIDEWEKAFEIAQVQQRPLIVITVFIHVSLHIVVNANDFSVWCVTYLRVFDPVLKLQVAAGEFPWIGGNRERVIQERVRLLWVYCFVDDKDKHMSRSIECVCNSEGITSLLYSTGYSDAFT